MVGGIGGESFSKIHFADSFEDEDATMNSGVLSGDARNAGNELIMRYAANDANSEHRYGIEMPECSKLGHEMEEDASTITFADVNDISLTTRVGASDERRKRGNLKARNPATVANAPATSSAAVETSTPARRVVGRGERGEKVENYKCVRTPDDDKEDEEVFRLNVGGKSYQFRREIVLFSRDPNSLLAILVRAEHHKRLLFVDGYAARTREYYLERNSYIAECIIDYFFTGKLHKPHDICLERFREEILFWHLTNVEVAPCCSILADPSRIDETLQIERELNTVSCFPELRKVIWHLMENPSSSTLSKVFSFISITFIFISVIGLIMGSMPEFQEDARFAEFYHIDAYAVSRASSAGTTARPRGGGQIPRGQGLYYDTMGNKYLLVERRNQTRSPWSPVAANDDNRSMNSVPELQNLPPSMPISNFSSSKTNNNESRTRPEAIAAAVETATQAFLTLRTNEKNVALTEFVYKSTDDPHHYLVSLENACIVWFTLEYFIRFLVSPRKLRFLTSPMNLIDLFTVFPVFIEAALSMMFGVHADKLKELTGAMIVIRILRVLRMARVFKLARYSMGLQVFGHTLKSSLRELCMLSMFLVTGTVFFSTIMYFLEKDEPNSDFRSIPAACWWCIITVTTVGYGDSLITTAMGKSVAAIASIFGIIILAFPISMVVENFAFAQEQTHVETEIREAQMAVVANDYLMRRYPSRRKACREPLAAEESLRLGGAGGGGGVDTDADIRRKSASAYHSIRYATRQK